MGVDLGTALGSNLGSALGSALVTELGTGPDVLLEPGSKLGTGLGTGLGTELALGAAARDAKLAAWALALACLLGDSYCVGSLVMGIDTEEGATPVTGASGAGPFGPALAAAGAAPSSAQAALVLGAMCRGDLVPKATPAVAGGSPLQAELRATESVG